MRHKDEYRLLQRVSAGDTEAFRIVYEHYYPAIYSFTLKFLKSPELSDDICQNVFIKIWEQRAQLSSVLEFTAWTFTIAKRQSIDFLKRAAREQAALSMILQSYPAQSNPVEHAQLLDEYMKFIRNVLERMPAQTQVVFNLCRQQAKTYEEAAAELGITRNAIKKHMIRSMRILKETAEKELGVSFSLFLIFLSSKI